jgi:hypothetical protein
MPVKVRCAECETEAAVPEAVVGRKVRCSKCGAQFVASPGNGVKGNGAVPPAAAVTVVARRVGGRPNRPPPPPPADTGSFLWVVAAVVALLLPIMFAAAFAYVKWDKGDHNSPIAAAGGGNEVVGGGAQPAAPRELYGAIEIASKGVKYTCFELSADRANELNPTPVADDSTDTNIVQGMDKSGHFDPARVSDSAAAARKFYDELTKNRGVRPDHVFVVGSSGLAGPVANRADLQPAERDDLIAKNRKDLGDAIRKAIDNKEMGFVNFDEEVGHQIEGVVPRADLDVSLLIDAGSGSTRGGYREGLGIIKTLKAPGVTEFQGTVARAVKDRGGASFADVAAELSEVQLRRPLRDQVESRPGLRAQDKVYLGGGIVWVMATYLHPEKCDAKHSYIGLSADDISRFADTVRANPDCLATLKPPDSLDVESRKKLEDDIRRMRKNFPPEALMAGAELLKALSAELDFAKKKELAFCRHSNVAWVMDYVASQARLKK